MAKITIDIIRDSVESQQWKLISEEYKNLDGQLEFECPEGHRVFAAWKKMRNACVCPRCSENVYIDMNDEVVPKKRGTKRVLALDQASRVTGWSIYDGKELVKFGTFKAPELDEIERYDAIKNWLVSMIANWKPDHIGLEGIQYEQNFGVTTFQTLARLQGILMECCYEQKVPFTLCPTNTWRNRCGVKGRARADRKRSAQLLIKEKYDVTATDDEADSILIGQYLVSVVIGPDVEEWE